MSLPNTEISLPRGVSDLLPDMAAKIAHIEARVRRVFELWGFRRVITPKLEYVDVLDIGLGDGLKNKTYRFDDRQTGRLLAFPPDITPQIARIAATRLKDLPLPHRLCYSGRVLRQTELQAGRQREILQSGVELIGLDSPEADAEMIAMVVEAMQALGLREFKVDLGQVEFCRGIMAASGLSGELLQELQTAVGRKDASAVERILAVAHVPRESKGELLALPRLFGGREVLDHAEAVVTNQRSRQALRNLRQVLEILDLHGVGEMLTIDLGEIRGLDYHTGITFECFVSGLGEPVCSGGRYDNLMAGYGTPAPATGFTFNIMGLLQALERDPDVAGSTATDFLLFNRRQDRSEALEVARLLRRRGYTTARDIIRRELPESLDYAKRMNIRCMLVIEEGSGGAYGAMRPSDGRQAVLTRAMLEEAELRSFIDGL